MKLFDTYLLRSASLSACLYQSCAFLLPTASAEGLSQVVGDASSQQNLSEGHAINASSSMQVAIEPGTRPKVKLETILARKKQDAEAGLQLLYVVVGLIAVMLAIILPLQYVLRMARGYWAARKNQISKG